MAYTGEYIILYDRLRDPDILNRLLKRNVYMDIEIAYLDVNWIYQYKLFQLNQYNSVLKLRLVDGDLEILDRYYGNMDSTERIATVLLDKVCWVYIDNNKYTSIHT